MAVGAHRAQIGNRVHLVLRTNFRQRLDVVNVDESFLQLLACSGGHSEPEDV